VERAAFRPRAPSTHYVCYTGHKFLADCGPILVVEKIRNGGVTHYNHNTQLSKLICTVDTVHIQRRRNRFIPSSSAVPKCFILDMILKNNSYMTIPKFVPKKESNTRFSASIFLQISFPYCPEYPIEAISIFYTNFRIYSNVQYSTRIVLSTPAFNETNFETESFSIFCLETIGLQYTLIG
jgi:hypothetical protein